MSTNHTDTEGSGAAPWLGVLSAAYFLSGFCALIYQAAWIRMFSRVFGSTVYAMSVVLAVFFGGLALGSHWLGRRSVVMRNPVRTYGLLEATIGAYVLAFPWLMAGVDRLYAALYARLYESAALLLTVRVLTSVAVLALPTILMGGTLPVLARHFVRKLEAAGPRAGLVYGLNALGAGLGSLLTGFLLIRHLGVSTTHALAGGLNLAIGAAALALSGSTRLDSPASAPSVADPPAPPPARDPAITLSLVLFGVSGFVSMAWELVWLRYLVLYFRDTIELYTAIITVFVIGIGAGSLAIARHASKLQTPLAGFGLLQAGIGISTLLGIYLPVAWYPSIWEAGQASRTSVLLLVSVFLIVPALLMGATFPVVARIVTRDVRTVGDRIGRAYALNMIGSILGSLAGGLLLFNLLGLQGTLYLLFGANMIVAALLLRLARPDLTWCLPAGLVLAFPFAVGLMGLPSLPEAVLGQKVSPGSRILEIREGMVSTTWATTSPNGAEIKLWDGSVRISGTAEQSFTVQGFIPLLIAPEIPQRVLGLAFGGGLSYYASRLFREVESLDFVDMSRTNMEVSLDRFPINRGLAEDPRARFVVDDAYNFVKHSKQSWDLILMEPTPPMYGFRTAALYTREFYAYSGERLDADGIFAQILPLRQMSEHEALSVMKTFASAFPHTLLWWNEWDCVMLGSRSPIRIDPDRIQSRIARPKVRLALERTSTVGGYHLLGNFLAGLLLTDEGFREVAAPGETYTDDHPGLEFSTGRNIGVEAVERIHDHLTPFDEARSIFTDASLLEQHGPALASVREGFMVLHYKDYPAVYYPRFLRYVENYSPDKAADLRYLQQYLQEHGMHEEATRLGSTDGQ